MNALTSMTIALLILAWVVSLCHAAHANGYLDYQNRHGWGGGDDITDMLSNQRNTEAMINESRAARGQPPCSIGLIGQWQGRPAC